MPKKKKATRTYESDTLALPPLKMVLGDVPDPDVNSSSPHTSKVDRKMEVVVQKLINHLKEAKL